MYNVIDTIFPLFAGLFSGLGAAIVYVNLLKLSQSFLFKKKANSSKHSFYSLITRSIIIALLRIVFIGAFLFYLLQSTNTNSILTLLSFIISLWTIILCRRM